MKNNIKPPAQKQPAPLIANPSMTPERYGDLVRNHFRLLAVRKSLSLKSIPKVDLDRFGAAVRNNPIGGVMIEVIMPSHLPAKDLDTIIAELEKESADDPCPERPKGKRKEIMVGFPTKDGRHRKSSGRPKKKSPDAIPTHEDIENDDGE